MRAGRGVRRSSAGRSRHSSLAWTRLEVAVLRTHVQGAMPASSCRRNGLPGCPGHRSRGHSKASQTSWLFENTNVGPTPRTSKLRPPGSSSLSAFALTFRFVAVLGTTRWSNMDPTQNERSATLALTNRKGRGFGSNRTRWSI